jgi:hypothetical protein
VRRGFHRLGMFGAMLAFAYAAWVWVVVPNADGAVVGGAVLLLGRLWYVLCAAVGWVIAGFVPGPKS